MFENYPKIRKELPKEFQKIYSEHYKKNRDGSTSASFLSQKMESWMHKKVAEDVKNSNNKSTLEIGAGTLNQLKFENSASYDIVEPFTDLYENSVFLNKINKIYNDISEIKEREEYDRITSIATFEHITDLPFVVAKSSVLLKKNGVLRVSIPNEGTFLWKLGWKLTSAIEFKLKYGLDYELLMKYEHVNTADEIEEVLTFFYKNVKYSCLGLNKKIAFYRFYECTNPKTDLAKAYLENTIVK